MVNFSFETKCVYDKVAGAGANCDHQNRKLRAVAGAEGFRVAELRVRQLKIGCKSCFGKRNSKMAIFYVFLHNFG